MFIIALCFITFISFGCGGSGPKMKVTRDVPKWFLDPPAGKDSYYGIGQATKKNPALAKQTADARARQDIVLQIETQVNTLLKDFMEETGYGDNAESVEYTQSVTEQVAGEVLKGCMIIEREIKHGTYYSLAEYNVSAMKAELKRKAKEEAKKNAELNRKLLLEKGFDALVTKIDALGK